MKERNKKTIFIKFFLIILTSNSISSTNFIYDLFIYILKSNIIKFNYSSRFKTVPMNSGTFLKSNSEGNYYYFIHCILVYFYYFINNKLKVVAKDESKKKRTLLINIFYFLLQQSSTSLIILT
jgi:hypothetical protein